jgi:hypothetical protein
MIKTFDIYLSFIVAITVYAAFNINPNQFWGWNDDVYNLFDIIINLIRFFFPTILVIAFSIYLFKKIDPKKIKKGLSIYYFILLSSYALIIISSTPITEKNFSGNENLYLFTYFNIFFLIFLINKFFSKKVLFAHFIFVLITYFIIIVGAQIFNYIANYKTFYLLMDQIINIRSSKFFQLNNYGLLGNSSLRSTGFARIVLLLWTISLYYQFLNLKNIKLINLIGLCLSFLIISLQSKFAVASSLIVLLFFTLVIKTSLKNLIKIFLINIIIPIIVFQSSTILLNKYVYLVNEDQSNLPIVESRYKSLIKSIDEQTKINILDKLGVDKNLFILKDEEVDLFLGEADERSHAIDDGKVLNYISKLEDLLAKKLITDEEIIIVKKLIKIRNLYKKNEIKYGALENYFYETLTSTSVAFEVTSGRSTIWKRQLKYIKENNYLILGKGIMADLKIFNITASNSLIYSWLSGGIFSVILYFLIIILITYKLLKFLITNFRKQIENNQILFFAVIGIFFLRSIVENSFMSINLDLVIILFTFELLKHEKSNFFESEFKIFRK